MQIVVSVYVSPNCISFLIVSSFSCNFNRSAVCFQSFSEHCFREYSKCRAYQTLLKITCTSIKNNHNKFFIMLKRNSVNVHSNTTTARSAKVRTGWPYILGDFGNFFNCLAKSPRVLRSIVLNIE